MMKEHPVPSCCEAMTSHADFYSLLSTETGRLSFAKRCATLNSDCLKTLSQDFLKRYSSLNKPQN